MRDIWVAISEGDRLLDRFYRTVSEGEYTVPKSQGRVDRISLVSRYRAKIKGRDFANCLYVQDELPDVY